MRNILTIILTILGVIVGGWLLSDHSIGIAVIGAIAGGIVGFIIGKFISITDIDLFCWT